MELICEHDWQLFEADLNSEGGNRVEICARCDALQYSPAQTALRDDPPPLR